MPETCNNLRGALALMNDATLLREVQVVQSQPAYLAQDNQTSRTIVQSSTQGSHAGTSLLRTWKTRAQHNFVRQHQKHMAEGK